MSINNNPPISSEEKSSLSSPSANNQNTTQEEQIEATIVVPKKWDIKNLWAKIWYTYGHLNRFNKLFLLLNTAIGTYLGFISFTAPVYSQFQDQLSQVYSTFYPVQISMGTLKEACLSNDKTKINDALTTLGTDFDSYLKEQRLAGKLIRSNTYNQFVHPFNANVNYIINLKGISDRDKPIIACKRFFSEQLNLDKLRKDIPNSIISDRNAFIRLHWYSLASSFSYNINTKNYPLDFNKDIERLNGNYELYYESQKKN